MYIYDISIKSNTITIKLDGITTQINEIRFSFHADSTDKKIISIGLKTLRATGHSGIGKT